ncbi:MAG: hypothetical protein DMD49_07260 [Gemmatimonadetes bacterium]|nr:MAG: hypothetical protein DMD49_07260 [Gemmatimonadota bacterium]
MRRWLRAGGAALLTACAARGGAGPGAAAPNPAPAPPPPPRPGERHAFPQAVRYGPSAVRYLIHRRLHIEQTFSGAPQTQDLGAHIFVRAIVTGPADSSGYPATFIVDSIVPDSGTPPPIADNISKARMLIMSGRVVAQGEFRSTATSDSVLARNLAQLLGNFRDFLPRIPTDGARLGAAWTDTLSLTQRAGGSEVTRRSVQHSSAAAWEEHSGARSLRLETTGTYSVAGSGQNGGQFFQIGGAGTVTARTFLAEDGRFVGGESQDSSSLTISLPAQGLTVPVTQVLRSTVAVLP